MEMLWRVEISGEKGALVVASSFFRDSRPAFLNDSLLTPELSPRPGIVSSSAREQQG